MPLLKVTCLMAASLVLAAPVLAQQRSRPTPQPSREGGIDPLLVDGDALPCFKRKLEITMGDKDKRPRTVTFRCRSTPLGGADPVPVSGGPSGTRGRRVPYLFMSPDQAKCLNDQLGAKPAPLEVRLAKCGVRPPAALPF